MTSGQPDVRRDLDRTGVVGTLVVIGLVLVAVSSSGPSLGIALPTLSTELGASLVQTTWISTVPTVVTASFLLPIALAADRYGRRRFLAGGLLVIAVTEIGTGLAQDPNVVIGLRALAGFGAACVLPTSLAVLISAFPRERRATAIAIWAATVSVSASLGGLASGVLVDTVSWRVMPIAIGITLLALILPLRFVAADARNLDAVPDPVGALLALIGVGSLVLGIGQAGQGELTDPLVLIPVLVGLTALGAFVWWELRTPNPMLPVRLFTSRALQAGTVLLILVVGSFAAYTFIGVQYLQNYRELPSLQSALFFLVTEAGVLSMTLLVPRLVRTLGVRVVGTAGALVVAAGFFLIAAVAPLEPIWPTAAALVVLGAGFALSVTPATTLVVTGLPADRLTVASAFNYVGRDIGGAVGTAVVASVLLAIYQSRITATTASLPPEQGEQIDSGIDAAFGVIGELGPEGAQLLDPVKEAFLAGFQSGATTAGVLCVLAAVICALRAPSGVTTAQDISPETPSTSKS